jgi:GT2 family glycosyltransferase
MDILEQSEKLLEQNGTGKAKSMAGQPSVFIIVLNWNGWEDTIECLMSVLNINYKNFTVVMLDNGSDDGSIDKIKQWAMGKIKTHSPHIPQIQNNISIEIFEYDREQAEGGGLHEIEREIEKISSDEKIILIKNNENLGFAKGNNVGVRYAIKRGADYVFLLNNDTNIHVNGLKTMIEFLENNRNYTAATSQIRFYDRPVIWNCGGTINSFYLRRYLFADQNVSDVPQSGSMDVSYVTGCSMLIPVHMINTYGMLCENFFFGEEDFEFALRAKKNKLKMACVFDSVVYHKLGGSINRAKDSNIFNKALNYYLNRFIDVKHYMPRFFWYPWVIVYLFYIFYLLTKKGLSFFEFIFFAKKLLKYSKIYDGIDSKLFKQLISTPIR